MWRTFSIRRILAFMPGSAFASLSRIELANEDERRLVINADGRAIEFDKQNGVISESRQAVAMFSSIVSVGVAHFINGLKDKRGRQ